MDNRRRPYEWNKFGFNSNKLELIKFTNRHVWVWENFLKDAREYWGADNQDKGRFHNYFGDINAEENFLVKQREGFAKQLEYEKFWKGLCQEGQTVNVVRRGLKNELFLTLSDRSYMNDHEDLELCLFEEIAFFGRHIKYSVDLYSSGTISVYKGSIEHQMGEGPGDHKIWNSKGRDLSVDLNSSARTFTVGDATFRLV